MGHTSTKIVPQRLLLVSRRLTHAACSTCSARPAPARADTRTARAHARAPAHGDARARPAPSRLCVGHGYLLEGSAAGGAGAGTCGSSQRGARPRGATAGRSGTPSRAWSAAPALPPQLPSVLLPCRPSRAPAVGRRRLPRRSGGSRSQSPCRRERAPGRVRQGRTGARSSRV
jgi:hypothetical protein